MDDARLERLLRSAALAVEEVLADYPADERERRGSGHADQYDFDVRADAAAVAVLVAGGVGVLSEESGIHHPERSIRVVIDPVDGSTNFSRALDPYGPSICALDDRGPRAAIVVNVASGRCFRASRGLGASVNDQELVCRPRAQLSVVVTGDPIRRLQPEVWTRISGASAHDLCRVADGTFDGYADSLNTVSVWDYAAAAFILLTAGGAVAERDDRPLFDPAPHSNYRLVAAASPTLLQDLERRLHDEPTSAVDSGLGSRRP